MHAHHTIQCIHDPLLVVLSYIVSVLGSYTALQLAIGIPAARTLTGRWRAITWSGMAMGGGAIWAMHFIAMLACRMDVEVSYDLTVTVMSALIGMVSCMAGLALAGLGVFSWYKLGVAGTIMGLGVAGMHYSGMAAMIMKADTVYAPSLVLLSVAIAIAASMAALWLAFNMRGRWQMVGSALVMGVAVCGMHYTGMAAASFVPNDLPVEHAGISGSYLGMGIFAVTTILLAVVLSTSIIRQRQRQQVRI